MYEIPCYDANGNSIDYLTQWDNDIKLYLLLDKDEIKDKSFICHFSNSNSKESCVIEPSFDSENNMLITTVPNILLQEALPIFLHIYAYSSSVEVGKTIHGIRIPVRKKAKPSDYIYKDNSDYLSLTIIDNRVKALFKTITTSKSSGVSTDVATNAEMVDLRIGNDGTVYESAGDAVRAMGNTLELLIKNSVNSLRSDIEENMDSVSSDVEEIKGEMQQYIDTHAVNGLIYEDSMLYLTSNGEIVSDPVEIKGGSGGGSYGSVVKLMNMSKSTDFSIAKTSNAEISFKFTSLEDDLPTGSGTIKIMVNGVLKYASSVEQGENNYNVKEYLSVGKNTVKVTVEDAYGVSRSINYTITVVDVDIEANFNDSIVYESDITFKYTPYGLIEKTIHIILDNTEIQKDVVLSSGKQTTKIIPRQKSGVHRLEVYLTAEVEGSRLESKHLYYDIMCASSSDTDILIASPFGERVAYEGSQITIPYTVYNPSSLQSTVNLRIYSKNLETNKTTTYSTDTIIVDRTRKYWITRNYPVGRVFFEISSGNKKFTHQMTIIESKIDAVAETNDLEFFLSSAGRSNNEKNPAIWENNGVKTTFKNVNWVSTGWVEDDNKDKTLRLNGDARAIVEFQPFGKDLRINGKTIEVEFAIRDVNNRDAVVIDCMSGGIGIKATADKAELFSEGSHVSCNYKEETKVRLTFCIETEKENRLLSIYLNGILSNVTQYSTTDNFQQFNPVSIKFGSNYCGVDIYTIRVYDTSLAQNAIKDNYISDIVDVSKKREVFQNNDIYDEYGNISYERVKSKIPSITIIGDLPKAKKDKKNVTIVYENPEHPDLNFTDDCVIDVQGTSSQFLTN